MSHNVLAFDLGASNGRAVLGQFDGEKLQTIDIHRFPNDPVRVQQRLHWDILRLLHEIKQGLLATRLQQHNDIQSIGIDTWGIDFGLIGANGELLGNPYHYRDAQTQGTMEEVWQFLPREEIFRRTGIQHMQINSLYQLYAMSKAASPLLNQAETLLMIPELLRYFLTGERHSEWTITSTTQLCNPHVRTWDMELIERLGLPTHPFLNPVAPGTQTGTLLPSVSEEVGIAELPVIAVAEHDTASAVVAVPAEQTDFAYLSSGTWSLIGTEINQPILSQQAMEWNVTNEGGINGTTRLLQNATGLWLVQECRRAWRNEGKHISFADESTLITQAVPFKALIDSDHLMFINPPHMPKQIQLYCKETGQAVPETEGEILRCIVESLALRYRMVLEKIEQLVQKRFAGLHVVGGGAQHKLLCQYTANALARPVWAGPQEATAIGNILVQYLSLGYISNIQQARQVVRHSFPIITYEPANTAMWDDNYTRFLEIVSDSI
jgi:rhamnulokinase